MYLQPSISENRTPIHPKSVERAIGGGLKVVAARRAVPFAKLDGKALLDTDDLCLILGASKRTIYRWMAENELMPAGRAGREYFFEKRHIIYWDTHYRPRPGRNVGS